MTWANISESEKTLIECKRHVQKKYGKLHTVFGLEVEKALTKYLKRQEEMGAEEEN